MLAQSGPLTTTGLMVRGLGHELGRECYYDGEGKQCLLYRQAGGWGQQKTGDLGGGQRTLVKGLVLEHCIHEM